MPNEVYNKSYWGKPSLRWGSVYEKYIGQYYDKTENTYNEIVSYWN